MAGNNMVWQPQVVEEMLRYYKEKIQAEGRQFIFKEVHYEECAKQINEKYHTKFTSRQVYHKFHKLKAQWKVIMEAKNLSGANLDDVEKGSQYDETEVVQMNNAKDKRAKYINVPIRCPSDVDPSLHYDSDYLPEENNNRSSSSSKRPKGSKIDKDGTLILLKGETDQATALKEILDSFTRFSGLQINYHKSTLVPIHLAEESKEMVTQILQCPTSSLPCSYLGLPLSTTKSTHNMLLPVISKVDKYLAGWMPLSKGGRLTMINSIISAIPTYYMSCCIWPEKSIEAIDKIKRAFLWQGEKSIKGGHCLVAWKTVLLQKQQGGLGIRDLRAHNTALILKLANRVLTDSNDPMAKWFRQKYLQSTIQLKPRNNDTPTWKLILSHFQILSSVAQVKLGNGRTTLFWKDQWMPQHLEYTYPVLFSFAINKECAVESQFSHNTWQLQLHPNLSYQAETELQALLQNLQTISPSPETADTRELLYPKPLISTANAYRLLTFSWIPLESG
ncbi:hypothetical protein OsJ_18161 [Oryza sativa Japonica Group]|uniref:Retrotransposon protein, putative, unclassified n=1 Tax=Oryza sativa subsp. japonica TaxID=39947 RepID=B9FP11_ORYSJ|nr:hypothetical protein OsJ_18161 [Oryza sativa Japonica Group]